MFIEPSVFQGLFLAIQHRVANKKDKATVVMEIIFLWEKTEDKYKYFGIPVSTMKNIINICQERKLFFSWELYMWRILCIINNANNY